jgi:transposase-like protein
MASLPGRDHFALCALVLRYPLSYRDLEEMMRERGLPIDHTTIYRSRAMLRTRTGEALQTPSQGHERLLARR